MNENILRQVEQRLVAKSFATNNAWLRECVEYYLSDHRNPSLTEVFDFVTSQWQLSDLREICNDKPCLPKNLADERCKILRGNFVLQMEKIYDISESKYKQLEKIRNLSNDNDEVTDNEKTQTIWEPKRKRMLYLHLTDGVENILAIEYKPIRFLNDTLLPGYKLLIKGPVTCRRGVIMLDETNVSEIGGEVESQLITNAVENVLARALNLPENPDPYNDSGEKKKQKQEFEDAELFDDEFYIDMEAIVRIERQSQEAAPIPPNLPSTETNSYIPTNQRTNRRIIIDPEPTNSFPVPLDAKTESDLFFDTIDDIIFDEFEVIPQKSPISSHTSDKTANIVSNRNSGISDNENEAVKETKKNLEFGKIGTLTKTQTPDLNPRLSLDVRSNIHPTNDLAKLKIDDKKRESVPASSPKATIDRNLVLKNVSPVQPTSKKIPAISSSSIVNSPTEKMNNPETSRVSKVLKNNRKITDYMKKGESSKSEPNATKSYDSICDVLAINVTDTIIYKTITGKITKFDKLSRDGQCWKLNATVTDNTGSIDTAFSSEILESMLGFSAAEFSQKKRLKKTDPEMENFLRQGLSGAEKKLMNLDDLLKVELAPDKKPKVVEIISKEKK